MKKCQKTSPSPASIKSKLREGGTIGIGEGHCVCGVNPERGSLRKGIVFVVWILRDSLFIRFHLYRQQKCGVFGKSEVWFSLRVLGGFGSGSEIQLPRSVNFENGGVPIWSSPKPHNFSGSNQLASATAFWITEGGSGVVGATLSLLPSTAFYACEPLAAVQKVGGFEWNLKQVMRTGL